jgi:O-antigen/teichoic acid export membrane protein
MTLLQRPSFLGASRETLRARGWVWLRAGVQLATVLLVAWQLGMHDFGRYVAAFAIASAIAPLFVGGPAYVYLDSHAAFGCTREQLATVWRRMLLVFGMVAAAFVPVCVGAFAGDWSDAGLWFLVGFTEIVLAGFAEMAARFHQSEGRDDAMGLWLGLPHLLRFGALLVLLAAGIPLTLDHWVLLSFGVFLVVAIGAARRVSYKDNPRALDTLMRLLRTGYRFGTGNVAHHVVADGDKPFVARIAFPSAAGSLFVAQRVAELFCLPLQTVIAQSLPRLLDATPGERGPLWRLSWVLPALYAFFAGAALFAIAPVLERLGPDFGIAATALRWLCWLPLLAFARGMLGNAAVVAGRHHAHVRGQWLGAFVRVVGAICLVGLFGWEGAIFSLLVAEIVPMLYLMLALRSLRGHPAPQQ